MVQPIQYNVKAPSAFESLVSGLRLGTSLQQIQLQREQQMAAMQQAQQQAEAERQRQMSLQEFYRKARNNEPLTTTDWLQYGETAGTKEYRELASRQIQNMSEAEQSARAGNMGQMISALWTSPDIGLQIVRDYKAANPNDRGIDPILKLAETRPKEAAVALYGWMSGLGGKFGDVSKNLADTLGMKAEKPAAEPEKIRILRAAGLEPTLENIGKLAAAERAQQPDEAMMQVLGIPRTPEGYRQFKELQTVDRGPLVQNILPGEPGGKAALEKLDVPRAQEFSQNATAARTFAQYSKTIADLLRGKGSGVVVNLTTDMMSKLGLSSSTVSARDLANSLAVRGATLVRVPGSGSTTDLEFKAYLSAFPSLQSSEAGREIMAKYADAIANRSARLADHARKLIRDDRFSEEEMARFDDSLGPVLEKDFYDAIGGKKPERANQRKPASQLSNEELLRQLEGK